MAKTSPILFVVIVREGHSLPPTGGQKLLPGDEIVAIMPRESFKTFRTLINRKAAKMKKIVVSGDSLTAIHLAEALKPLCEQVILTDPDLEHGRMAASILQGVEVFHVDCTNSDMLEEIKLLRIGRIRESSLDVVNTDFIEFSGYKELIFKTEADILGLCAVAERRIIQLHRERFFLFFFHCYFL